MSYLERVRAMVASLPKLSAFGVGDEFDTTPHLEMERSERSNMVISWENEYYDVLDFLVEAPDIIRKLLAVCEAAESVQARTEFDRYGAPILEVDAGAWGELQEALKALEVEP
jgi:hypothetical protein